MGAGFREILFRTAGHSQRFRPPEPPLLCAGSNRTYTLSWPSWQQAPGATLQGGEANTPAAVNAGPLYFLPAPCSCLLDSGFLVWALHSLSDSCSRSRRGSWSQQQEEVSLTVSFPPRILSPMPAPFLHAPGPSCPHRPLPTSSPTSLPFSWWNQLPLAGHKGALGVPRALPALSSCSLPALPLPPLWPRPSLSLLHGSPPSPEALPLS